MVGRTVAQYVILDRLGGGGMGEIYRAKDTRLNRTVAIKVLPAQDSLDEQRRQRFIQEAQAASGLNHPNIVTVHDILTHEGLDLLVMELISGKTLAEIIPAGGLPVRQMLNISVQVADALAAAHAAGIVHRDIKPGNVMVTASGLVKVLDFGLAKPTLTGAPDESGETRSIASPLTVQGTVLGTVNYMSPEQAEGKRVDGRSDVFSLGILMYEMLTGHPAFKADSMIATMSAILRDEARPIRQLAPETPQPLVDIVERSLRKVPEQRWQSMHDLRDVLQGLKLQFDTGSVPSLPPTVRVESLAPRRKSKAPMLAGAAVLLLAALGGGGWWFLSQSKPAPAPAPAPPPPVAVQQPEPTPAPVVPAPDPVVTNDTVIDLVKNTVPVPVILDHIRSSKTNFDLSTAEVIRLSKAGVPANVIQAMRDPAKIPVQANKPLSPPAIASKGPAPSKPAPTPPPPASKDAPSATATVVPAPAVPAPIVPPPPVPAAPVVATKTVSVADGVPFAIELTQDVPNDAPAGTPLRFRVVKDVLADGAVVIAKGATVTGQVVDESRRKALVVNVKMTYQLLKADAVDGQKLTIRTTPARGQGPRPLEPGAKKRPKDVAVASGTQFIAYVEGAQSLTLRK